MRRPDQLIRIALVGAICLAAGGTAVAQPGGAPMPPPPPPDDPYGPPSPDEPPPPPPGPAEPAPPPPPTYPQQPPPPPPPYAQPNPYAQPPPPRGLQRQGWFIGFSLGAGSIALEDNATQSDSYGGMNFGLQFGGMLNPRMGLMVTLGGGAYSIDEDSRLTLAHTSFGLAGQYWAIPQLWLRLGVAGARLGTRRDGEKIGDDLEGMLVHAGVGYEVWQGRRFAFDISLNAAAGRYDPDVQDIGTTQAGLALGFNWY
jgi:hypothetical protein